MGDKVDVCVCVCECDTERASKWVRERWIRIVAHIIANKER